MNRNAWVWLAAGMAVWAAAGCERTPKDVAALRAGTRLEAKGDWNGAKEKYLEACGAGNGEGYKKMAELLIHYDGTLTFVDSTRRDEAWLGKAQELVERIAMLSTQAEGAGVGMEGVKGTLETYRKSIADTRKRLERERAEAEEAARAAEEARRRAEAEAAAREKELAAKRAAEAAEAQKRLAEQERRESAEYCIENGLELTRTAFREICKAMNYTQDTGNTLVDDEEEARQHARFRGKIVVLDGSITKVDSKFFGGVKIKLNVYGESVWANFPNMPESEGKQFRTGQSLTVEGKVEFAPINPFNLGNCRIR